MDSMGTTCPECGKTCASYKGYGFHYAAQHDGNPLVALVGEDELREAYAEMSENQVADHFDVSRTAVKSAIASLDDVERRGQSDAEKHKNARMTAEERAKQTRAARERQFEKYGDGGFIGKWVRENPDKQREASAQGAPLGTPARKRNGMEGVTGQDHPRWRGGKSIYDAVKKQLPGPSWHTIRIRERDDECAKCGVADTDRRLDVHHIVPILAGGTNEAWNLLTLCRSCHHRAEWMTRDVCDPVLLE